MIDTRIYKLKAELHSSNRDDNGRHVIEWATIHAQVNKDKIEYTTGYKRALVGDFEEVLPHCTLTFLEIDGEQVAKLEEIVRNKETVHKILLIKPHEDHLDDFEKVCLVIREHSMGQKDIGRPILVNSHTGRGISALSRKAENQSYRGLVNILIILLVASNAHNILKVLKEDGWIFGKIWIDVITSSAAFKLEYLKYLLYGQFLFTGPLISVGIEKYLACSKKVPRLVVFILIVLNLLHMLAYPCWYGAYMEVHMLVRIYPLLFSCMWFLKLCSYHHIWHDVRYHQGLIDSDINKEGLVDSQGEPIPAKEEEYLSKIAEKLSLPKPITRSVYNYPKNVNLFDVIIFCLIPTLNFQLKYPFKKTRNYKRFVLRLLEVGLWQVVWVIIMMEYVFPLVHECSASFKKEDYVSALYYFIRLAVPNTYSWLIMFYSHFHTYFNAFADLTGFSDRCFYLDWWNSTSLSQYWRKWNLPVHNWLTRHIYLPSMRRGHSKALSMFLVFLFSAVLHEFIICGILERVSLIGFNSMAIQVPFIILQETFKKSLGGNIGNFIFWMTFCVIGQPAGMVMGYILLN
ncbi:unnamed protein product [Moneuplotes crassus]|uniref:diacylglycerol O-acyltransferase n=2 Tax=Euplotes crassus TaxID=5936 RepID=A0AAD1X402_EUPCR|nr:unnamed protein product [Moneuplotes crassus]